MQVKSGIEMIEIILEELSLLHKKMDLLDANIKRLMNEKNISSKPKPKMVAAIPPTAPVEDNHAKEGIRNFKFEPTDASKTKQESPNRSARDGSAACMCEGKMIVNNGGKPTPLSGLSVKIYNDKDKLIKETKTNRSGIWMSKLSVGNYVALIEGSFNGKDLYPANITFKVLPGMERLEVK